MKVLDRSRKQDRGLSICAQRIAKKVQYAHTDQQVTEVLYQHKSPPCCLLYKQQVFR